MIVAVEDSASGPQADTSNSAREPDRFAGTLFRYERITMSAPEFSADQYIDKRLHSASIKS
jgi:hypothetical protein